MRRADLKFILLGECNAGKTSIFMRYFKNKWNPLYHKSTIGADIERRSINFEGEEFTLQCWDTAGSERYEALTPMFYRDADCAILCFDPSSETSWSRVINWATQVKDSNDNCKLLVCATKKDLIDSGDIVFTIDRKVVRAIISDIQAAYVEASSRTGENIDTLFNLAIEKCLSDPYTRDEIARRREQMQVQDLEQEITDIVVNQQNNTCRC